MHTVVNSHVPISYWKKKEFIEIKSRTPWLSDDNRKFIEEK